MKQIGQTYKVFRLNKTRWFFLVTFKASGIFEASGAVAKLAEA